jgi:DNA-binding MarR family transcriptional regulator
MTGRRRSYDGDFVDEVLLHVVEKFPWADPAAVELSYRLVAAFAAARRSMQRLLSSIGYERAAGKIGVLRSLYFSSEGMSQQEISENMNITSASITYLVDALVKDDLVERIPHPSDRRITWVGLTPKGRETFESIAPAIIALQSSYSQDFTPEEREQFAQFLIRFRKNADEFRAPKLD